MSTLPSLLVVWMDRPSYESQPSADRSVLLDFLSDFRSSAIKKQERNFYLSFELERR